MEVTIRYMLVLGSKNPRRSSACFNSECQSEIRTPQVYRNKDRTRHSCFFNHRTLTLLDNTLTSAGRHAQTH